MAKPIEGEPGSAMHVHQSILITGHRQNIFSNEDGSRRRPSCTTSAACSYIPAAMVLVAPYVNSYRRLSRNTAAPDQHRVGLRQPHRGHPLADLLPQARRVENRVIGADANPYVALAMTLACGYLGLKNKIKPKPEMKGDAYLSPYSLPRSLGEALDWLRRESDLHEVLGKEFITVYTEIKELEFDEFMKVISPWEREHLCCMSDPPSTATFYLKGRAMIADRRHPADPARWTAPISCIRSPISRTWPPAARA
jgi:glutamine synthetase